MDAAKYEYIAIMDSDDIAVSDRFEKQMAYIEAHPEVDALGGQIAEFIGEPSNVVGTRIVPLTDAEIKDLNMDDDHYFDDDYYFFFDAAKTDEEAIRQECLDYHSFGGDDEWLDNDYHPSMPEGEKCPWPGCGHVGE